MKVLVFAFLCIFLSSCSGSDMVTGNVVFEDDMTGPYCVLNGCIIGKAMNIDGSMKCTAEINSENSVLGIVNSKGNLRFCDG